VAIISALVLFGGNVAALYVGRILNGLGIGLGAGTGTAWLAELIGKEDKNRATAIATSANFLGLGVGALISGLLAQYNRGRWSFRRLGTAHKRDHRARGNAFARTAAAAAAFRTIRDPCAVRRPRHYRLRRRGARRLLCRA
jgi:MFS family permease